MLDVAHPEKDALIWERAIRKLRGGMMPPPGAARPTPAEVNSLATYLEDSLDKAGAANPNPGSVRIHRLNRAEYANAARDIFGIDVDAGALLPTDDISEGFDNIASALKVSPSFLDQYLTGGAGGGQEGRGDAVHRHRSEVDGAGNRRQRAAASRKPRRSYRAFSVPV